LLLAAALDVRPRGAATSPDVRALWVVRNTLTSTGSIDQMIAAARASGFNTLLVQVRGRADAYYRGGLEPSPPILSRNPSFDPLGETVSRAHAAGLQVHAWVNVNLVAGANELPAERDHVLYRHPEWLMVPRALAADLSKVDPRSPEYVGRLARHLRARSAEVEGFYLSPTPAGAIEYTAGVMRDIIVRYPVDGLHLDNARYPADDFDYSAAALAAFRRTILPDLSADEQARYESRLEKQPLIYTQAFPDRWRRFRVAEMNRLMQAIHDVAKSARPALPLSAAVVPDADEAIGRRFQDWRTWLAGNLIDVLCPMAYTTDRGLFASQVAAAQKIAGDHTVWAGIGAYRLSSAQIADHVQAARRAGAGGIILFSYDSLTGPSRGRDYLADVARAAFMP
jgi:uncharacterized lipoprotein YddW (UPF0748 family)